jgi:lycopene cyclase domain-containing protein
MTGSLAYLGHLGWALPVIALQLVVVWWRYGVRTSEVLVALAPVVLATTAWFVAADAIAIGAGIWWFPPSAVTGMRVGPVPVEEIVFFLLTNTLIALGVALIDGLGQSNGRPA